MKEYNFNNIHWQVTSYNFDKYIFYKKCFRKIDSIHANEYDLTPNNYMYFAYEIKTTLSNNIYLFI